MLGIDLVEGALANLGAPMMLKETALIRALGITKIPMLFFAGPRVLRLDDEGCEVVIPLGYRTKNHLGSMYLGALCAGADLASGLNAAKEIRTHHPKVKLAFKDLKAEFLKRADGDVHFISHDGQRVKQAMTHTEQTGERVTLAIDVVATVPKKYGDEPVAKFTLGLSLKKKD